MHRENYGSVFTQSTKKLDDHNASGHYRLNEIIFVRMIRNIIRHLGRECYPFRLCYFQTDRLILIRLSETCWRKIRKFKQPHPDSPVVSGFPELLHATADLSLPWSLLVRVSRVITWRATGRCYFLRSWEGVTSDALQTLYRGLHLVSIGHDPALALLYHHSFQCI